MSSPINKAVVKRMALDIATKERPVVGFTRVSAEFLEHVESVVRTTIVTRVRQQPSKGVTLR